MTTPSPQSLYRASGGTTSSADFLTILKPRNPTFSDMSGPNGQYPVTQRWTNTVTNEGFYLAGYTSSGGTVLPDWRAFTASGYPAVETLTGDIGGPVGPDALSNINLLGSNLTITGDPINHTLMFSVNASGYGYNVVSSIVPPNPIQITTGSAYICVGGLQVTFTLPFAPAIGDTFKISSLSASFLINQNAGQVIQVGNVTSLPGALHGLYSNAPGDLIILTYVGSNTFQSNAPQGTLTIF